MKEAIKILLVMTLFAGILLLMGCGKQEETVVNPIPAEEQNIIGFPGFQLGTTSYTGVSTDGRWMVAMIPSRRIDPDQFHTQGYIDVQVLVRDTFCGNLTYQFQKTNISFPIGGVIQTTFTSGVQGARYTLTSHVMYGTQYPDGANVRNVLFADLTLEVPATSSCEAQGIMNGLFQNSGAFGTSLNNNFQNQSSNRVYRIILQ